MAKASPKMALGRDSIAKSSVSLLLRRAVLQHCLRLRAWLRMIWKLNEMARWSCRGADPDVAASLHHS
jgi:hypothetical protein